MRFWESHTCNKQIAKICKMYTYSGWTLTVIFSDPSTKWLNTIPWNFYSPRIINNLNCWASPLCVTILQLTPPQTFQYLTPSPLHLKNLHFHTPELFFYQKQPICSHSIKTGVCVSLQINNVELVYEIYIYHWKAYDIPFNKISTLILFTERCQWFWWIQIYIFPT